MKWLTVVHHSIISSSSLTLDVVTQRLLHCKPPTMHSWNRMYNAIVILHNFFGWLFSSLSDVEVLKGWRRWGSSILYRRTVSSFVHECGFANLLILCHSLSVQVQLPECFFDPSHSFQTRNIALDMATCTVCLVAVGLDKCNGVVFNASRKMPYV